MGIVFRQAIKTTIVTFTGALLGAFINYIYTKVFPQNQVGVSRNLLNQGQVLYLFLLMGTISLVHTYAQRYRADDPRRPVLITYSLMVPLLSTALFCLPYFLLRHYIVGRYQGFDRQYIIEFYLWLPILSLLLSYMTLLEYYLASRMKVALGATMREIVLRIANVVLIALFYFGLLNFHWFVVGTVLVHLIPITVLLFASLKTEGFHFSLDGSVFDRDELKRVVHYAWYHLLLTVILNLNVMLDVVLIGMLSKTGLRDVAIYNLAVFLINILTIPYRAMTSAAFPKINQAFVDNDVQLNSLFTRSAINIQIVSVLMWLLIAVNRHNATAILDPAYAPIAPAFMILSFGRMIDMATGLNTELISISNHYKFTSRLAFLLLVSIIVFDRIFIPKYGIYGAAWVSTITLAAFNICKLAFLYIKMKVLPFTSQSLVILGIGAVVFLANYAIPTLANPIADTLLRSSLIVLCFGSLLLLLRPSTDLSHYLRQVRKDKRLF